MFMHTAHVRRQERLIVTLILLGNRPTYPGEFDGSKHLYTLSYPVGFLEYEAGIAS